MWEVEGEVVVDPGAAPPDYFRFRNGHINESMEASEMELALMAAFPAYQINTERVYSRATWLVTVMKKDSSLMLMHGRQFEITDMDLTIRGTEILLQMAVQWNISELEDYIDKQK